MILNKFPLAVCSSPNIPISLSLTPSCICITSPCSPSSGLQRSVGCPPSRASGRQKSSLSSSHCYNSQRQYPRRNYATIPNWRNERERDFSSDRHRWPTTPRPTPYEIFNQERGVPYSKRKFYELVKIYHPDRHHLAPNGTLSHSVRLERYRLVVAANDILCDPTKRRAYDLYGAGWADKLGFDNPMRDLDKDWRKRPGNASMNATWEDWERWYEERDGKKKQEPVFMSNELFVVAICAIAIVGSMGQARRASTTSMNIVDMQDRRHESINQGMRERQGQLSSLDRHGRIENFLRQREGWALASSTTSQTESYDDGE